MKKHEYHGQEKSGSNNTRRLGGLARQTNRSHALPQPQPRHRIRTTKTERNKHQQKTMKGICCSLVFNQKRQNNNRRLTHTTYNLIFPIFRKNTVFNIVLLLDYKYA